VKHLRITQNKVNHDIVYGEEDKDDRIVSERDQYAALARFSTVFKNVSFVCIPFNDIRKGHLTKMWNVLFRAAYDEGCDYFYQCGDDIAFQTTGWVNDCIKVLREHGGVGLAGPINNNFRILTQAFVSRKHLDIFGWFFAEEIINWCCDDWFILVFSPYCFFPLREYCCWNTGGDPRYTINNSATFVSNLALNPQKL